MMPCVAGTAVDCPRRAGTGSRAGGGGVFGEEFRELEHAVLRESEERQKDEALDVAITAIRFVQEEYEREGMNG